MTSVRKVEDESAISTLNNQLENPNLEYTKKAEIYHQLGDAYFGLDKFSRAKDHYSLARNHYIDPVKLMEMDFLAAKAQLKLGQTSINENFSSAIENMMQAFPCLTVDDKYLCENLFIKAIFERNNFAEVTNLKDIINFFKTMITPKMFPKKEESLYLSKLIEISLAYAKTFGKTKDAVIVIKETLDFAKHYNLAIQDEAKCYYKMGKIYYDIITDKNQPSKLEYQKLALVNFKKSFQLFHEYKGIPLKGKASTYLGALHNFSDHYFESKKALHYFHDAILHLPDGLLKGMVYHDCGLLYRARGNHLESKKCFANSILIFSGKKIDYEALSHQNKAHAHIALQEYPEAIFHAESALQLWEKIQSSGIVTKHNTKNCLRALLKKIAPIYLETAQYNEAIDINDKLIVLLKERHIALENQLKALPSKEQQEKLNAQINKIKLDLATSFRTLGFANMRLGKIEEADKNFSLAIGFNSDFLKNVDVKFLDELVNHVPNCLNKYKIYLSKKQLKHIEEVKSKSGKKITLVENDKEKVHHASNVSHFFYRVKHMDFKSGEHDDLSLLKRYGVDS